MKMKEFKRIDELKNSFDGDFIQFLPTLALFGLINSNYNKRTVQKCIRSQQQTKTHKIVKKGIKKLDDLTLSNCQPIICSLWLENHTKLA